jgi:hypothetical protein
MSSLLHSSSDFDSLSSEHRELAAHIRESISKNDTSSLQSAFAKVQLVASQVQESWTSDNVQHLLYIFMQQHAFQEKQKPADAKGKQIFTTDYGILGADAVNAKTKEIVCSLLFTKQSIEFDNVLLDTLRLAFGDHVKSVTPVPGVYLTNPPKESDDLVWQTLHGTDSCSLVALIALTPVNVNLMFHSESSATKWAQLCGVVDGRKKRLPLVQDELQKQLNAQKAEQRFCLTLDPGQVLFTHRGMPLAFSSVAPGEKFMVKTTAFEKTKNLAARGATYAEALEKHRFTSSALKENVYNLILPKLKDGEIAAADDDVSYFPLVQSVSEILWLAPVAEKLKTNTTKEVRTEPAKTMTTSKTDSKADSKKKTLSVEQLLEQSQERAAQIRRDIDGLDQRVWNPALMVNVEKKEKEIDEIGAPDRKCVKQYMACLETLATNVAKAKESAPQLESILAELGAIEEKLNLLKSRKDELENAPKQKTGYEIRLKTLKEHQDATHNLIAKAGQIAKFHSDVTVFCEKTVAILDKKASSGGGKRQRAASSVENKVMAEPITVPVVDEDNLPEIVLEEDLDECTKTLSETQSRKAEFSLLIQKLSTSEARDLYQRFNEVVKEKADHIRDVSLGEEEPDEQTFDFSLVLGYRNVLEDLLSKVKATAANKTFSASTTTTTKKSTIKCKECGQRRANFESSGWCPECYIDVHVSASLENIETRGEMLPKEEREQVFQPKFEKLDTIASELFDKKLARFPEYKKLLEELDGVLPPLPEGKASGEDEEDEEDEYGSNDIEEDEEEEDEEEEDEDEDVAPGLTKSRRAPLGDWNSLPRLSSNFKDADEDDEEEEQEAISVSAVKSKKRERDEDDVYKLGYDTLEAMCKFNVGTIEREFKALFKDPAQHAALKVRVDHYRNTLKKVYAVQVHDAQDDTLEPFEHETYFISQEDAIKKRNEYTLTGLYKAQIIIKEII